MEQHPNSARDVSPVANGTDASSGQRVHHRIHGTIAMVIASLFVIGLFAYAYTLNPSRERVGDMSSISTSASNTSAVIPTGQDEKLSQFVVRVSTSTKTVDIDFPDGHTTQVPVYWGDYEGFVEPSVEIVDVDFDGYDDVLVSYIIGAYNMATRFYAQDPDTREFHEYVIGPTVGDPESDPFSGLGMVTFYPEKREIHSFWKGRGFGDMYSLDTYSFLNDAWVLTRSENQDWIGQPDSDYYIRKVTDYSKGKSSTTSTYLKMQWKDDDSSFDLIEVSKEEAMKHADEEIGG